MPDLTSYKDGIESPQLSDLMHANKIATRNDLYNKSTNPLFAKTWRFGVLNPYGAVSATKEFLFFTKPDLNIIARDDTSGYITGDLNPNLGSRFWKDMYESKKRTIALLQNSYSSSGVVKEDPFNHLLQNTVISNLTVPSLESEVVETASNIYGVNFTYRGSSEASDDGPTFSLEFKDDRWLNVYSYFKAYEEYETAKHHGTIRPWRKYIEQRILHDQIAIYKFIVDEDMETIIYYGKYYGCMPLSLPRDVFNSENFENGLSFSIDWKAAFYEDMNPEILEDFNAVGQTWWNSPGLKNLDIYREDYQDNTGELRGGGVDNRAAAAARVIKVKSEKVNADSADLSPNGYVYKLKWKG